MNVTISAVPPALSGTFALPCLSLYQRTYRSFPENRQDRLRFKNLVGELEESLRRRYPGREVLPLIEPFRMLEADDDFWTHALDGLGAFGASGFFRVYRFEEAPRELAVVGERFHTKPLLRVLQGNLRFHILALTRQDVRLYEADRTSIEEVRLHPSVPRTMEAALGTQITDPHMTIASFGPAGAGGSIRHGHRTRSDEEALDNERFFRAVDLAVTREHSKPSGLPLMLASLAQHQSLFRRVSANAALMEDGISSDPHHMPPEALRSMAWAVIAPVVKRAEAEAASSCGEALSKGLGTDDLLDAARAAVEGRVALLLLERSRVRPGKVDALTGEVAEGALDEPDIGDLFDDLGDIVLSRGGEVLVLEPGEMPTVTGLAARYRY